ncbi:MAG: tetratricopeptide repeat protein, partial [Cytophagales bacterium]|nr:tetratricopeptide repeat protein [Cytophagales bacterium]
MAACCVSLPVFSQKKKGKKQESEDTKFSEYYFTEGIKEFALGNYPKCLQWMEEALKTEPDNAAIYYQISKVYGLDNATIEKAIKNGEKALSLSENNKYYYLQLTELYEKNKDYSSAIKTLQKMIKKVPNSDPYYLDLASLYIREGKLDDAIRAYNKAEN